jgi:hypothetical protein
MIRALLFAVLVVVVLAFFDVQTGVQAIDQLIGSVPIDWLREVIGA